MIGYCWSHSLQVSCVYVPSVRRHTGLCSVRMRALQIPVGGTEGRRAREGMFALRWRDAGSFIKEANAPSCQGSSGSGRHEWDVLHSCLLDLLPWHEGAYWEQPEQEGTLHCMPIKQCDLCNRPSDFYLFLFSPTYVIHRLYGCMVQSHVQCHIRMPHLLNGASRTCRLSVCHQWWIFCVGFHGHQDTHLLTLCTAAWSACALPVSDRRCPVTFSWGHCRNETSSDTQQKKHSSPSIHNNLVLVRSVGSDIQNGDK